MPSRVPLPNLPLNLPLLSEQSWLPPPRFIQDVQLPQLTTRLPVGAVLWCSILPSVVSSQDKTSGLFGWLGFDVEHRQLDLPQKLQAPWIDSVPKLQENLQRPEALKQKLGIHTL